MPPKADTIPAGIQRLSKLLSHLNKPPKLTLNGGVKAFRISLAYQNDHFGARHFVKEDLPRIRFANPNIDIQVQKVRKEKDEEWRPHIDLEYQDGQTKQLDLHKKWSTTILKELMDAAGGDPWKAHVAEAERTGMPVLPGENVYENKDTSGKPLPTLEEYLALNPAKVKAKKEKLDRERKAKAEKASAAKGKKDGKVVKADEAPSTPTSSSTPPPTPSATETVASPSS